MHGNDGECPLDINNCPTIKLLQRNKFLTMKTKCGVGNAYLDYNMKSLVLCLMV
jgi:hypothetical protein